MSNLEPWVISMNDGFRHPKVYDVPLRGVDVKLISLTWLNKWKVKQSFRHLLLLFFFFFLFLVFLCFFLLTIFDFQNVMFVAAGFCSQDIHDTSMGTDATKSFFASQAPISSNFIDLCTTISVTRLGYFWKWLATHFLTKLSQICGNILGYLGR